MPFRAVRNIAAVLAALLLAASPRCAAAGPQVCAGLFNSPKGFGLSLETGREAQDRFFRFTVYADIYGLPRGRADAPGAKANFSTCRRFAEFGDGGIHASFYAGPGLSVGWVHDLETSVAGKKHLVNNPGLEAALSGVAGLRLTFPGKSVELDFSILGEAGFLIRQDEFMDNWDLTLFTAGLHQTLYPQIIIIKRFR